MINPALNFLKEIFDEDDFNLSVRAFRENEHIWKTLQNPKNLSNLSQSLGTELSNWTPSKIALVSLGYDDLIPDIENHALLHRSEIGFKAASALDILLSKKSSSVPPLNLNFACLAALGIREKWLIQDQAENTSLINTITGHPLILPTVGTLLFGMVPNPEALISSLLQSENPTLNSTAIQAVISQAIPIQQQTVLLIPSLRELSPYHRSSMLIELNQYYPALAQNIATQILEESSIPETGSLDPYQQILHHVEKTELLKITKQFDKAMPTLEQIWEATTRLQADLAAQIAQAATKGKDQETATKAIRKVNQFESLINEDVNQKELTRALINTGSLPPISQKNSDTKTLSEQTTDAAILISNSQKAFQNSNLEKAKELAIQAYQHIETAFQSQQIDLTSQLKTFSPDFLQTTIELLLNTNALSEANSLAAITNKLIPNHPEILLLAIEIAYRVGETEKALEFATVAAALSPNNAKSQKRLISLLKESGQFQKALTEADRYLAKLSSPTMDDYNIIAECAFLANDLEKSEQYCMKGLTSNPNAPELLILLGKIQAAANRLDEAISSIEKAILAAPNLVTPWLVIADFLLENNQPQQAVEKLISAVEINPSDPSIFLKIGKIHLELNNTAKSLEVLNQALGLITSETDRSIQKDIHFHLGQALIQAGYFDDAKSLLEKTYTTHPADEQIAHLYSHALIKTNELEKALKTLEIPIQSGSQETCLFLDYAETLIQLEKNPTTALEFINQVIKIEPDNPRAKILKAHATASAGKHKQAIQLYQNALQTKLGSSPDHFIELVTGIARSAHEDNQPEVALTFLKEASQKLPGNLILQKLLCEALTLANLKHEAYAQLLEIYQNHSHNLELLIWISDQAIALKEMKFSKTILDQALQIAPQKAEIIVRLGYIQLETGQVEQSRSTFEKLFSANNTEVKDLKMAAHALITQGDIATSIPYIERALEINNFQSPDLLNELTELYLQLEQFDSALQTIQRHLDLEPENANLWLKCSKVHTKLHNPKAALEAIFKAISFAPESAHLHANAAELLRHSEDLHASLEHIQKALQLEPQNSNYRIIAANIFKACLMFDSAKKTFEGIEKSITRQAGLLQAEILLDNPELPDLASVKKMIASEEKHKGLSTQLLAAQSRIFTNENKLDHARKTFEKAKNSLRISSTKEINLIEKTTTLISLGQAALKLHKWEEAIDLANEAVNTSPNEPRALLFRAQAIINRAEFQQNCRAVKCAANAPGSNAINVDAIKSFQTTIKALHQFDNISEETAKAITHCETRGKWALNIADPEPVPLFNHVDVAAYIAACRRINKKATLLPEWKKWTETTAVKFQLSLAEARTSLDHALRLASEAITDDLFAPLHLANYAFIATRTGNYQKALYAINQALAVWGDEPAWHELAAQLHKEMGNNDQSINHLEIAARLDAKNPKLLLTLAQTYAENQLPENAIPFYQNAIKLNPVDAMSWTGLAKAQLATKTFAEAQNSIEKAIQLDSGLTPLLTAVDIAQQQNNLAQANKYLNQALLIQPQSNLEINTLTELMIRQRRTKEALEKLDKFISQSQNPIPLMLQKANLLGKVKNEREKQKYLILLAQDHPKNSEILAHLAFSYVENGQHAEAIRTGQFALKKAGSSSLDPAIKANLHYHIGRLLNLTGQLDQSIHHLTQAIKYAPTFIDAYLQIGETLQLRREYAKAMDYLKKATEISPSDARPLLAAGLLYKESKDYSQAETYLRRAAALAPKDVNIQRQLAQVYALALIHQPLQEKV